MIDELYEAFRRDKDFNKSVFRRQAALMRGQILNLTTALKDKLSPWQLVQLPLCSINKDGQIKYIVCALQLARVENIRSTRFEWHLPTLCRK